MCILYKIPQIITNTVLTSTFPRHVNLYTLNHRKVFYYKMEVISMIVTLFIFFIC